MATGARKGRKAFQALFPDIEKFDEIIRDLGRKTKKHLFSGWVWDHWQLEKECEKGKTTMLVKLFPKISERLADRYLIQMSEDYEAIRKNQEEIIRLLKSGAILPTPKQSTDGSAKPLGGGQIALAMPVFNDEDDMEVTRDLSVDGSANFLDAAFGFQEKQVHQ